MVQNRTAQTTELFCLVPFKLLSWALCFLSCKSIVVFPIDLHSLSLSWPGAVPGGRQILFTYTNLEP